MTKKELIKVLEQISEDSQVALIVVETYGCSTILDRQIEGVVMEYMKPIDGFQGDVWVLVESSDNDPLYRRVRSLLISSFVGR